MKASSKKLEPTQTKSYNQTTSNSDPLAWSGWQLHRDFSVQDANIQYSGPQDSRFDVVMESVHSLCSVMFWDGDDCGLVSAAALLPILLTIDTPRTMHQIGRLASQRTVFFLCDVQERFSELNLPFLAQSLIRAQGQPSMALMSSFRPSTRP